MIYRLQRKFIAVSAISILIVIVLVFALINIFNMSSMNHTLDTLAEGIANGGGKFPDSFGGGRPTDVPKLEPTPEFDFITPETRFSTRYFTVWFDSEDEVIETNTEFIYAITEEQAIEYAKDAINDKDDYGWITNYRYKVFTNENEKVIIFVDGSLHRASFLQSMTISAFVLFGCAMLVLVLIILLSKRVVRPIADSYEKQKQFVTDANHELKTPLTLILANLDIVETEMGKNEWLEDIRTEGHRMTELVNQLVALSRMDEENQKINFGVFSISDIVSDTLSDFKGLAEKKGKKLISDVDANISYKGDEPLIRKLMSILMDNALKYCDMDGEITITLEQKHNIILTIENTYCEVESIELNRLFDRFYRADKARTYTGGYGIGLSIAKAIVEAHHGEITAYKKDATHIGFKVILK